MDSPRTARAHRPRRLAHVCATLLIAAAACGSKPLQKLDASGGGIGPIGGLGDGGVTDGGGSTDGGGAVDRPSWEVPFSGRRSFNVTAQVFTGGATSVAAHDFTMTLDMEQEAAVLGVPGGAEPWHVVEVTPGVLRIDGSPTFGAQVSAPCGGSMHYDDLRFTLDASGGLSGNGRGTLTSYDVDRGQMAAATVVLTGVPDDEPPTLSVSAGGDLADPWTPIWVISSEPLMDQQKRPVLRSTGGDVVDFSAPSGFGISAFVTVMTKPTRMLRFNDEYRITFEGVTDLAGNAVLPFAPPAFTTRAPPPLVAADGFESITDATVGGAQVLSGAGAPTISGARSLYIPPAASLGPSGRQTQLALRLPVGAAGDRFLHFDYRTVNPSETGPIQWVMGGAGGMMQAATLDPDLGVATTAATIDSVQVALGPTKSALFAISSDEWGEIVIARIASQGTRCGGPAPPPVPGIIIDNLRTTIDP